MHGLPKWWRAGREARDERMSRGVLLCLNEADVIAQCLQLKISVSAIERLLGGAVRLVCSSSRGAAAVRQKLKRHIIEGTVTRKRYRPATPIGE